jgi:hypothetical protein
VTRQRWRGRQQWHSECGAPTSEGAHRAQVDCGLLNCTAKYYRKSNTSHLMPRQGHRCRGCSMMDLSLIQLAHLNRRQPAWGLTGLSVPQQ